MRISNMAAELPLDTVIGPTYDTIDIMMQPEERETARQALELWFLLLNHGYRIAATASSDTTFDRPGGGIPGKVRVYTRVNGRLTPQSLTQAVRQGRSFVTSGPLVLFDIDGHGPGQVVKADATRQHTLKLQAWPSGAHGSLLRRVELIRNGAVIEEWSPAAGQADFNASKQIFESGTAWYVVRCFGEAPTEVAISNPVYFEGADYQAPVPASAHVTASVRSSQGEPLDGTMNIVRMDGRKPVKTAEFPIVRGHFAATVPATARLEATVPGYTTARKSIFMDYAPLLQKVLNITPAQLSDWKTFEEFRDILRKVRLEFQLQPAAAARTDSP